MGDEGTTDEALLLRFAGGDRRAMDAIFERHAGELLGFMVRFFGRKHVATAEDAAQEVWVKVLGKAGTFKGESFRAWLYAIARNACTTVLRKKGGPLDELPEEGGQGDGPSVPEQADRNEAHERATRALAVLSLEHREAFLLHTHGLTAREVAAALEINVNTAVSRIQRATQQLKDEIARLERAAKQGPEA